jgi:hypothetical protein
MSSFQENLCPISVHVEYVFYSTKMNLSLQHLVFSLQFQITSKSIKPFRRYIMLVDGQMKWNLHIMR